MCRKRDVDVWSLNSIIHYLSLKQRSYIYILVIFIQHLMPSKNWFWTKWSKYLLFGGKLAVGLRFTLASTQHLLFLAPCIYRTMWEPIKKRQNLLRSAQDSFVKRRVPIESIVDHNIHLNNRVHLFFLAFQFSKMPSHPFLHLVFLVTL